LRRGTQAGWLPVGLLGVAALAHDRGIPLGVESEYLPPDLVTGTAFEKLEAPDDGLKVGPGSARRNRRQGLPPNRGQKSAEPGAAPDPAT
jgi:hypothetical protein